MDIPLQRIDIKSHKIVYLASVKLGSEPAQRRLALCTCGAFCSAGLPGPASAPCDGG